MPSLTVPAWLNKQTEARFSSTNSATSTAPFSPNCFASLKHAVHADLRARVASGQFREDLYYRLAEITLELSPLRERAEDIPLLCRHFLQAAAERHGRLVTSIEPALLERLQAWSWPGNIRELRSTIERLVLLAHGPVLRDGAWTPPTTTTTPTIQETPASSSAAAAATDTSAPLNKRQRRELALRLLEESGGDQTWVAARLGIHPTTLYRWRNQTSAAPKKYP